MGNNPMYKKSLVQLITHTSRKIKLFLWWAQLSAHHCKHSPLLHRMQLEADRKEREKTFLEEMERYREIRAEEREKDKLMFEEVLRKWLTEERGACFHGKQPPAF